MKRFFAVVAATAALFAAAPALSADQQVDADTWRCGPGTSPFGARTDGLCWDRVYKTPALVTNGEVYHLYSSPAFYESFAAYEDGDDLITFQEDWTAADTSTGTVNLGTTTQGLVFAYAALGAGQTANLDMDAGSLDISGDQANDEGYQLWTGMHGAVGHPYTIGQVEALTTCATVAIGDVSDTDDFRIGWRLAELPQANFNAYNTYASIGVAGTDIEIETELNDAGLATTDTTHDAADGTAVTYCVLLSNTGVASYTLDGAAPATVPTTAFTFDDGDMVIPFIYFLNGGGTDNAAGEVDLTLWVASHQ